MKVDRSPIWFGIVLAVALWQVIRQAQIMRSKDPDIHVVWPFIGGGNRIAQAVRLACFSVLAALLLACVIASLVQ